MANDNKARLKQLLQRLTPEQIEALKDKSTWTRIVWAESFLIRNRDCIDDRPENQDLEVPMSVQLLRIVERASQKLDKIDANTSKAESFLHGLANIFKFGGSEAEKVYPSKKK